MTTGVFDSRLHLQHPESVWPRASRKVTLGALPTKRSRRSPIAARPDQTGSAQRLRLATQLCALAIFLMRSRALHATPGRGGGPDSARSRSTWRWETVQPAGRRRMGYAYGDGKPRRFGRRSLRRLFAQVSGSVGAVDVDGCHYSTLGPRFYRKPAPVTRGWPIRSFAS